MYVYERGIEGERERGRGMEKEEIEGGVRGVFNK
jgi:hypothetical protein